MSAFTLKDRITEDMKAAMRARETERLGAIRLLLAAIKQKEIDERIVADDTQVARIVDRLIKQRRDAIAAFEQAGRTDLADREKAEVAVLAVYLPARLSDAAVAAEVDAAIAAAGAAGPQDLGKVMAVLKPRLADRADLATVSGIVKARLAQR
jgi:uncharacterized protein YqeY